MQNIFKVLFNQASIHKGLFIASTNFNNDPMKDYCCLQDSYK